MFSELADPKFEHIRQTCEAESVEPLHLILNKFGSGVKYVAVGELHDDAGLTHRFLYNLLQSIAIAGVDALFLELDSLLQPELDTYHMNGDDQTLTKIINHEKNISQKVTQPLSFLNSESSFTTQSHWISGRFPLYFRLMEEARKCGISIIAIDDLSLDPKTSDVDKNMASNIIRATCKKGLVYVGSAHLCGSKQGGFGISSFMPVPSDVYTLKPYTHKDPDIKYLSENGISQRLYKLVENSRELKEGVDFALDFTNASVYEVMKMLYPKQVDPRCIADGLIYFK